MDVKIKFCGAAGTVTGSCFWVQCEKGQFLVDCGLFQGSKTLKELNYSAFPFDPEKINFMLLTHAHADHSALVPKLIKNGFDGPIYTTAATRDLAQFMLPDSGYIQEMEVKRLNMRNSRRGRPIVQPIYTREDAENTIPQFRAFDYEQWFEAISGVRFRFWNAGHILGSASIEIEIVQNNETVRMLFSGDLGPEYKLLQHDPDAPENFDYVFCESTYGGRERIYLTIEQRREKLAQEINDAMNLGGNLIIPSFAVERSQELLLDIAYLLQQKKIPCTSVFLDSPLAINITSVFSKYAQDLENTDEHQNPFTHPLFRFTETVQESKSIAKITGGAIILAASGMCDAGRIRHHLKNNLWNSQSTILFVGYQAEGTLGRFIEKGAKNIKIQGEAIKVRARIRKIDDYSGHADNEELIEWIKSRQPIHQGLFLIHGSKEALKSMKTNLINNKISQDKIFIPSIDDEFILPKTGKVSKIKTPKRRINPVIIDQPDWHNKLANLTLEIRKHLEDAPTEDYRNNLLLRLQKAMKAPIKKD